MRQRLKTIWDRFWLWLYRYSGKHVGPGVDEYWDQHWIHFLQRTLSEDARDPDRIPILYRVIRDPRNRNSSRRDFRDKR